MRIKKGDFIFKQGQRGQQAYLIEEGQVEIFHTHKDDAETHLAVIGEGELFGEMALIDSSIRSASTRALTDCKLLVIERDQLIDKINASDSVVQLMMRILLKRLRLQNQATTGLLFMNLNTDQNNNAVEKLRLENQIFEAFKNKEFRIYHQPIVSLKNNVVCGSEALIRWNSPTKGLIVPGQFVDVLENSSMIVPVGYWIFEECFEQYKKIKNLYPQLDFSVSINVSGRQFAQHNFVETLQELVSKHQVPTTAFKLEITERVLMEGGASITVLKQCHEMGFQISLDDFGTGFSSLQYLAQMPIDFIKIDRSFVMHVNKDEKTLAVVSSIIYLAQKLDIKVIAEGIESVAEETTMRVLGSDMGQGYLYSKPVAFEEMLSLLASSAT